MGTIKTSTDHSDTNVIDFFSGKSFADIHDQRIIRLAPELDGLEMLYSNESSEDKLFSLKILCWALRASGEVVGLVPWLGEVIPCHDIADPLNGNFEGYFDARADEIFFEAPIHKVVELETAAEYYDCTSEEGPQTIQEIPDLIGTHAVMANLDKSTLTLQEIVSWQLNADGELSAMIIDTEKVENTPVLPGDACLYSVSNEPHFKYFFQHHIANKIKSEDPDALAAISLLVEEK